MHDFEDINMVVIFTPNEEFIVINCCSIFNELTNLLNTIRLIYSLRWAMEI